MNEMIDCRQHNIRCKRQRGDDRPWCNGSIVRAEGHGASDIAEKLPLPAVDDNGFATRSIARGNPPTAAAASGKVRGIINRILSLYMGGTAAVLEVVNPLISHKTILNAAH